MNRKFSFKPRVVHEAISKWQHSGVSSEVYGAGIDAVVDDNTIKDTGTVGATQLIEIASDIEVLIYGV